MLVSVEEVLQKWKRQCTFSKETHLINPESETENLKWDIPIISKMRRPGEKLIELKKANIFFTVSKEKEKTKGS